MYTSMPHTTGFNTCISWSVATGAIAAPCTLAERGYLPLDKLAAIIKMPFLTQILSIMQIK